MSKTRPHERHIFPPDDGGLIHTASPWCRCKPTKRGRRSVVYVHRVLSATNQRSDDQ